MTPVEPEEHPTTAVGAAHRFNKITGGYGAEPYSKNRVRITVSVDFVNVLSDAYHHWAVDHAYGDDCDGAT